MKKKVKNLAFKIQIAHIAQYEQYYLIRSSQINCLLQNSTTIYVRRAGNYSSVIFVNQVSASYPSLAYKYQKTVPKSIGRIL